MDDPFDFGSFDDLGTMRRQRRSTSPYAPYPEDEEQSLIDKYILSKAKGGLQYAAETLDKPGRAVRGLLAGRPEELANLIPFSDAMGLTNPAQATSGRDLLESYGVLDQNTPGLDFGDVAGFGAELLTDPLSYIGVGALTKTGKAAQAAGKATKPLAQGIRAGERALLDVGIPFGEKMGLDRIPIGTNVDALSKKPLIGDITPSQVIGDIENEINFRSPGSKFRVFDKPEDIVGADRSASSELGDWGWGPFAVEFTDASGKLKRTNNPGALRGAIDPDSVKRIFFKPDEIIEEAAAQSEWAKYAGDLKQQFPGAEFTTLKESPAGEILVDSISSGRTNPIAFGGTGETAAKIADFIAKPIDRLKRSTVGLAATRVLDAPSQNMQTELGQRLGRETFDEIPREVAVQTKPLREEARNMLKGGVFDEDHIKAMVAGAEDTFSPYTKDAMGNFIAVPASHEAAAKAGEKIRNNFKSMIPKEYRAGLATEELADEFIPYMARYHHSEQRGLLQGFAERFHKSSRFVSASRLDHLKGIPGGTKTIEEIIQEPLVWDLPLDDAVAKVSDMTGGVLEASHARDLTKWVRRQNRENFYDIVPETMLDGTVIDKWVPNGRRFFNGDPATDAIIRTTRHVKQMKGTDFVKNMAVQGSKKADEIPTEEIANYVPLAEAVDMPGLTNRFGAIMGKASNGGTKFAMSSEGIEARIARDLGVNPHELTVRNALVDGKMIKKNTIKGLEDRMIHKDHVADIQRAVNIWNSPEELSKLADLYDTGLTLWKTTQTGLWPAFHSRNAIGGLYYHMASGAAGEHSKATLMAAHAMRKGDEIAPEVLAKMGYKSTQEAIADAQAYGALRSGSTFSDDAMGGAAIESGSAKTLGPIGVEPQSKLEAVQAAWERAKGAAKSGEGKWGKIRGTVDSIIDSSRRVGNFTEDILRSNQFFARKMQGWTSEAAAMDVKKWYFNFDELTETERNVFKRVIPFYSWLRFNTPLVAKELVARPGGPIPQSIRFSQQGRQDQGYLPEHIGEGMAISTGAPGQFLTGLGLPYESAFQQLKIAPTLMKTLQRTGESQLASAAPPLSGAYSLMSGRDPYSGRELSDLYPYPTGSTLANLAINKTLGRGLTEYRKATDERKGWLPWALGATTGIKIEDLSGGLERQKQLESKRILGNIMDESPRIKSFTNYYADPRQKGELTPEEIRNLKLAAGLSRKGREAAKKQKLTEQQKFLSGL